MKIAPNSLEISAETIELKDSLILSGDTHKANREEEGEEVSIVQFQFLLSVVSGFSFYKKFVMRKSKISKETRDSFE